MFNQYFRTVAQRTLSVAPRYHLRLGVVGVAGWYLLAEKELDPQTTLLIEFDKIEITERKLSSSDQLNDSVVELRELTETLEVAAADNKICEMVSTTGDGSNLSQYGKADVEEICRAVKSFSKKKNATIVQENIPSLQACFLSSAFPESILHPRGVLTFDGLSATRFFAYPMLKRHGVRVDVFRHGRYKSAPSFFSSSGSTKSERENLASVQNCTLRTLWQGILADNRVLLLGTDVTERMKAMEEVASALLNDTMSPNFAYRCGFIHGLGELAHNANQLKHTITLSDYMQRHKKRKARKERWNLLRQFICSLVDATSEQARFQAYNNARELAFDPSFPFMCNLAKSLLQQTPKIPVVYVSGEIGPQCAKNVVASLQQIQREIAAGAKIRHVILRVSSPGGDATSSKLIADQLDALPVPVSVSFGNAATSGGYWIAAKSNRIFSNEMTCTGSIGVYVLRFDLSKTFQQKGINVEHMSTGFLADLYNPFHRITADMKDALSRRSAITYNEFKERVAHGRNISMDQVEVVAQGRVYTGKQAKANGLVDTIGGLKEVIDYVRLKHGMEDAVVESYPEAQPFGFSDALMNMLFGDAASIASVVGTFGPIDALLRCVQSKNCSGKISDTTMLVADEETAMLLALGVDQMK